MPPSVGDNHGTGAGGASITHAAGETFLLGRGSLKLQKSSSQYVTVDGLGDEGLTTSDDVTITMWFNTEATPTSPSDNVLFSAHTASGGNLLRMGTGANGGIYLNPTDLSGPVPDEEFGAGYNDGQWHFLSVLLEADGTTTVYVDLDEVPGFTDRAGQPKWSTATKFTFGQEWDGGGASNFYDGLIADARIYDTRLTGFQLQAIYSSAIPEPSTLVLLGLGAVGLLAVRRRRK